MMKKQRTQKKTKVNCIAYLLFVVVLLFGNTKSEAKNVPVLFSEESGYYLQTKPNKISSQAEESPSYKGGQQALMQYLAKNLKYPSTKAQGKVLVQFIVRKDGTITDAKILKGAAKVLNDEALRVVRSMPAWNPGKLNGEPVDSKFVLPVVFKYNKESNNKNLRRKLRFTKPVIVKDDPQ